MSGVIDIELEDLTAAAFAPFGEVIGLAEGPPVFSGPHIKSWRQNFACDGPVEVMTARYAHQPMTLSLLERHFNVTQAFIPMTADPWVMVVAGPTAPEDRDALPAPKAARAFLVAGGHGIMLARGAWHALTRFPANPAGASFVLITGADTQRELERQIAQGTKPTHTQVVDLARTFGKTLRVVDPRGLCRP